MRIGKWNLVVTKEKKYINKYRNKTSLKKFISKLDLAKTESILIEGDFILVREIYE